MDFQLTLASHPRFRRVLLAIVGGLHCAAMWRRIVGALQLTGRREFRRRAGAAITPGA